MRERSKAVLVFSTMSSDKRKETARRGELPYRLVADVVAKGEKE